MIIYQSHLLT